MHTCSTELFSSCLTPSNLSSYSVSGRDLRNLPLATVYSLPRHLATLFKQDIKVLVKFYLNSVNSPIMATLDPLPIIAKARLLNGGWARRHLSMLIGKHGG